MKLLKIATVILTFSFALPAHAVDVGAQDLVYVLEYSKYASYPQRLEWKRLRDDTLKVNIFGKSEYIETLQDEVKSLKKEVAELAKAKNELERIKRNLSDFKDIKRELEKQKSQNKDTQRVVDDLKKEVERLKRK